MPSPLSAFFAELRRRRVVRAAAFYGGIAFVIIQIIDGAFSYLHIPEWFGTAIIILLLIGFPVAMVLAWAFDITEDGIVRAKGRPVDAKRKSLPLVGNTALAIIAVLAVAFGVWSLWGGGDSTLEPTLGSKSIAVLPFENLSPDPDNEYFSDGMTEELISKLSRIHNLQVVSRTSVARFKGTKKDIKEIGEELAVRYVLEGSVRKAGNRVRITAQLIDASTGFQLWSDDFDGELQDVFAVQEETALKIAAALDLHLSPQETEAVRRRHTQNPEAYDAYLRGWALVESFHARLSLPEERLEAARAHFEQALAFDEDYPLALAGLAAVDGLYYYWGVDRTPERLQSAEELAHRALALDPQLPEAHAALALVFFIQRDVARSIDEYRQALRLDPRNAYVWCELAWACIAQDPPDPEEAEKAAREAIRLAPGYFWSYAALGRALDDQGRYEEAIASYEYAVQLEPDYRGGYVTIGLLHLAQGNYNQALAQFDEARRIRETPGLLVLISAAYAGLGDTEKALAELEQALAAGYRDFAAIDADPHLASLRDEPRFQQLVSKYGGR